jgi:hypothetical protein
MSESLRERERRILGLTGWSVAYAICLIQDGERVMPLAVTERGGERRIAHFPEGTGSAMEGVLAGLVAGEVAVAIVNADVRRVDDTAEARALLVTVYEGGHQDPIGVVMQTYAPAKKSRLPWVAREPFRLLGRTYTGGFDSLDAERLFLEGALTNEEGAAYFKT